MQAGPGLCESFCHSLLLGGLRQIAVVNSKKGDNSFAKLRADPFHPSLHFKQVGRYWSARVDYNYRAVAIRDQDDVLWFWIGTHSEYDRLLN